MTRNQRRTHLQAWIVLGPVIVILLAVAVRQHASSITKIAAPGVTR
jgi:hypothetical protein